jgi:hypothetical protein
VQPEVAALASLERGRAVFEPRDFAVTAQRRKRHGSAGAHDASMR